MSGDPLDDLATRLQAAALAAGRTVAIAESCTGGMVAAAVTAVPGSSGYFVGGVVSYSDEAKRDLLGVDPAILDAHGAVSAQVAMAMAVGARARFAADLAASVTGIAGPGGGTADKPVGLVYIGLSTGKGVVATKHLFNGTRADVRLRSSQAALALLRDELLKH